ncbi:hypothetical protein G6F68_020098 [Rhizopus microsporus]|nr:hypothetical protein G6F68_020098 [Rhizopus microsporus]
MLADRLGRAAHAVHRDLLVAAAAAPPLAHVLQPLGALVVLLGRVVPDGQVGRHALGGVFDPDRHVGAVVLGHVQARHLDVQADIGRLGRSGDQAGQEGRQEQFAHGVLQGRIDGISG